MIQPEADGRLWHAGTRGTASTRRCERLGPLSRSSGSSGAPAHELGIEDDVRPHDTHEFLVARVEGIDLVLVVVP